MKRVRGALATALCLVAVAGAGLGTGPALADPDQPVDPQVVDAPPLPPPLEPANVVLPPPPPPLPDNLAPPGDVPPPPADVPPVAALPVATGAAKGQNATPYTGDPVFAPPAFNPVNGALVGVAKPIIINFQRPIANRPLAEQSIHISSAPAVPGAFYWTTDTQVRWRPYSFWPAGTQVHIDASGAQSNFRVGDALVANVDDKTHQMTVTRNGVVL